MLDKWAGTRGWTHVELWILNYEIVCENRMCLLKANNQREARSEDIQK